MKPTHEPAEKRRSFLREYVARDTGPTGWPLWVTVPYWPRADDKYSFGLLTFTYDRCVLIKVASSEN